MSTNIKITILLMTGILVISAAMYKQNLQTDIQSVKNNYHKTAKNINIIKQIDTKYGQKSNNKRELNSILNRYSKNIVSKKEDKNGMEFIISKLDQNSINVLSKSLINSGLKILSFKIKRVDDHTAELSAKVLF